MMIWANGQNFQIATTHAGSQNVSGLGVTKTEQSVTKRMNDSTAILDMTAGK